MNNKTTFSGHGHAEEEGTVVNIEGQQHKWTQPSISMLALRDLGKIPADQAVVCEDAEGWERTLKEDEVVTIKRGHRFGRAPIYKRG
jgi:hypothetical protein